MRRKAGGSTGKTPALRPDLGCEPSPNLGRRAGPHLGPDRKPPDREPPGREPPKRERQGGTGVETEERQEAKRPDRWKVVLYNDNYTTMEFVVEVLVRVFKKDHTAATQIMLRIHNGGKGVAGVYIQEIAETKVATVHRLAERRGFPLRAGLERE